MATTTQNVKTSLNILKDATANASLNTTNPFGFITDSAVIQAALDKATNAAYDKNIKEATLGLNKVEDTSYANTQNSINELRNTLAGGVASGANRGAANAAAIQAILGLGQQNAATTTEGLQNIQGIAGERAAALAQNAVNAINQSNTAKAQQATAATEQYTADQTRSAEALAALAALQGTNNTNAANERMNTATNNANIKINKQTNASNERMNTATNNANKTIANKTQKQQVTYINK